MVGPESDCHRSGPCFCPKPLTRRVPVLAVLPTGTSSLGFRNHCGRTGGILPYRPDTRPADAPIRSKALGRMEGAPGRQLIYGPSRAPLRHKGFQAATGDALPTHPATTRPPLPASGRGKPGTAVPLGHPGRTPLALPRGLSRCRSSGGGGGRGGASSPLARLRAAPARPTLRAGESAREHPGRGSPDRATRHRERARGRGQRGRP